MNKIKTYRLVACLFLFTQMARGDTYPFNKNIDIIHYAFEITVSDSSNEIFGNAQITILFKNSGVQHFRLDFINKSDAKQGKGMQIDAVKLADTPINYTHQNDEIILSLPTPSTANTEMVFTIQYHGIPFDGLKIGATKFGDRSFFCENWPNKARQWLPTIDHPTIKLLLNL
ncbi:MAG: hypothetical protein IPF93_12265 [Saprospiraceae bacterium]|nr:hypothetical protein [Saprospiraceae bacterium]